MPQRKVDEARITFFVGDKNSPTKASIKFDEICRWDDEPTTADVIRFIEGDEFFINVFENQTLFYDSNRQVEFDPRSRMNTLVYQFDRLKETYSRSCRSNSEQVISQREKFKAELDKFIHENGEIMKKFFKLDEDDGLPSKNLILLHPLKEFRAACLVAVKKNTHKDLTQLEMQLTINIGPRRLTLDDSALVGQLKACDSQSIKALQAAATDALKLLIYFSFPFCLG